MGGDGERERERLGGKERGVAYMAGTITLTVPDYIQGSRGPPLRGVCPCLTERKTSPGSPACLEASISPVAAWFNIPQALGFAPNANDSVVSENKKHLKSR